MNLNDLQREFSQFALVQRGMRPRTLKDILRILQKVMANSNTQNLSDLSTSALTGYFEHGRNDLGWSPKTFRIYWQYLKTYFDWCTKREYLKKNPILLIERPRLPKRLPRCLTHDDAVKVLYTSSRIKWYSDFEMYRNETLIATLMMSGLRIQELLNLRTSHVNLTAQEIFVESGKGAKDRMIPIHPQLLRLLKRFEDERKRFGKLSEWYFPSSRSPKQLLQKNIRTVCHRISKESGIKFTPHILRHTFAREMLDSGLDLYKLKELLGHSNVATTQIYASVSRHCLKESVHNLRIY